MKPSPRTTGVRAEADRAAADAGVRRAPRASRPPASAPAAAASRARAAPLAAVATETEPVEWPADAVEVGRIVDAWGVQGGLRVQPFSGDPQALFSSRRWFLRAPEAASASPKASAAGAAPRLLRISGAREQGDVIVASSRDLPDRNAAEALRGWRIFVSRGSFPSTAQNEYYWVDLIGLEVVNREGASLGNVADLMDTGAHSVLRVTQGVPGEPRETERLIPFVAAYVDEVSLERRRITVDWGLDY